MVVRLLIILPFISTLFGQALKAIFKMNKQLNKFINLSVKHRLELYDKLIAPILSYCGEVWGFVEGKQIEKVHIQFCKKLLGVKRSTQNDFVYGELGRMSHQALRYYQIIRYWIKIINSSENKYIRKVYNMLLLDMETNRNCKNW